MKNEIDKQKDVAFYSASIQAWYTTKMELDKSILTLSSAAIGLLITFKKNFVIYGVFQSCLYVVSLLSFLAAIVVSLMIFSKNAEYIKNVIKSDSYKSDGKLGKLDTTLKLLFGAGIVLAALLSLSPFYELIQRG